MFSKKIEKYITSEHLLQDGTSVIVALSGGADSVALFRVLSELGYQLKAVHCNFHLRGAESDRDELFVRELCAIQQTDLEVVHFDTEKYAAEHRVSIEMAARELRYNYFEHVRMESGAEAVAVAHHRDDSVETLLLNLIRGTGINGLKGIRPKNGYVVRPLLVVSRQEILDYLKKIGQDFVTDSTNLHDDYTRNKIRLNLIPLMEQINPSVKESLWLTANRLAETAAVYNRAMEKEKERVSSFTKDGNLSIDINAWFKSDAPRNLLYELLSPYGFNASQLEDIYLSAGSEPGRRFYSSGYELLLDRGCWLVYPLVQPAICSFVIDVPEGTCVLPDGSGILEWRTVPYNERFEIPRERHIACLDTLLLEFPLGVRRVEKGDRFVPFGMRGQKTLSDYMTDRKFSLHRKKCQWVVCSGEKIVWLVGERSDNRFRITAQTRQVLVLTFYSKK